MTYEAIEQPLPHDKRIVCDSCGAEGYIQLRTYCSWDEIEQRWEPVVDEADDYYCNNCGQNEVTFSWVNISD